MYLYRQMILRSPRSPRSPGREGDRRPAWRAFLVALLIFTFGGGCSVKVAYNNLDRLSRWAVSDYIDMTDAQREYFDAEMAKFLYWHRTRQLPEWALLMDSLPLRFADGATMTELEAIIDQLFVWYEEIEITGMPMGIEMMLSLTDEQIERLPYRFEKDNEKLEEDEVDLTVEQAQARWKEEVADGFARFTGKLTAPQRDYLGAQSVRYIPQYSLWADYRRRWQADLLALLREQRGDQDLFESSFRALVAQRESVYYGDELLTIFEHNEQLFGEVSVWLFNHLTDRQKDRFATRTRELAEAFRELAAQAPAVVPADRVCLVRC